MRWQMTLKDPSNTLPDLVLANFGDSGYARSHIQNVTLQGFTGTNYPVFTGRPPAVASSASKYRFIWEVACDVTEPERLLFDALVAQQDSKYASRQDGRLILIDELELLPPEQSPHSKTIHAGAQTPFPGFATGYGKFWVKLQLPGKHIQHRGVDGAMHTKLIQFSAIELPGGFD